MNVQDKPLAQFAGVMSYLRLFSDKVIINQDSAANRSVKTIYLKDVTGVTFKEGGALTNGYIQFSLGGNIAKSGTVFDVAKDENAVLFRSKSNSDARQIYEEIERARNAAKTTENSNSSPMAFSTADEIAKFKALLDSGVLTQGEFDAKKKQLLGL